MCEDDPLAEFSIDPIDLMQRSQVVHYTYTKVLNIRSSQSNKTSAIRKSNYKRSVSRSAVPGVLKIARNQNNRSDRQQLMSINALSKVSLLAPTIERSNPHLARFVPSQGNSFTKNSCSQDFSFSQDYSFSFSILRNTLSCERLNMRKGNNTPNLIRVNCITRSI